MNRRTLLSWLAATAWMPYAALAQQAGKVWRIGVLRVRPEPQFDEAFRQGLRDRGYVPGRNLVLEYRFAEDKPERFPALAAELVRLKVDVIAAGGSGAILAAKEATTSIPIVMAVSADPVRSGWVANLARPGGNITGVSILQSGVSTKWLELIKETLPTATRIAFLGNPANPTTSGSLRDLEAAARTLGLKIQFVAAADSRDFPDAFAAMARDRAEAMLCMADAVFSAERKTIIGFAAKHRLPAIYQHRLFVDSGGLMSYGPNLPDLFRRAAAQVDQIFKGTKPGEIPVEQPTKYDLVVNMRTARSLGLKIPQSVLLRAEQVIE
jgi:putative tryptophan/tyrosine transport system substrate-binding protein